MNKSDLTEKLKDALDRKCYENNPKGWSKNKCPDWYSTAIRSVCFCCKKHRDLAQELADITEEHYKEVLKCPR